MQGAQKILGALCCAVVLIGCSGSYTTVPEENTSLVYQASTEDMARRALDQLCSFQPQELAAGTVVNRIRDFVHPDLWAAISTDPSLVVPEVSTETREQWERHGGMTAVAVSVSGEQHPPDTTHSWNRKMDCERFWPGFSEPFVDVYAVTATEVDGVWKLQRLQLL